MNKEGTQSVRISPATYAKLRLEAFNRHMKQTELLEEIFEFWYTKVVENN